MATWSIGQRVSFSYGGVTRYGHVIEVREHALLVEYTTHDRNNAGHRRPRRVTRWVATDRVTKGGL